MIRDSQLKTDEKFAFRIDDASKVCGLSRTTLYQLIAEKKLHAVKIAGRRLILREDLQAFLHTADTEAR